MSLPALLMPAPDPLPSDPPARALAFYRCQGAGTTAGHDLETRARVAEGFADLLGYAYAGQTLPGQPLPAGGYVVPSDTIGSLDEAHRLGIFGLDDLFGGVVPHPFVATKVVTHGLVDELAEAPPGWAHDLALQLGNAVLPGYSVFNKDDAWRAGVRMLPLGAIRLKAADGVGGSGQTVARSSREFAQQIDLLAPDTLARGLVIERNLADAATWCVGLLRVGGKTACYAGKQRTTRNHRGQEVYGGSSLTVVPGDFDALMRLDLSPRLRLAIDQARRYHHAMHRAFPGMFASRCNYDVVQGFDPSGRWLSGVLEQSWRIGGCSGAELLALRELAEGDRRIVRASTHEIYGAAVVPRDAKVFFEGDDPEAGRLLKYAMVHPHVNA